MTAKSRPFERAVREQILASEGSVWAPVLPKPTWPIGKSFIRCPNPDGAAIMTGAENPPGPKNGLGVRKIPAGLDLLSFTEKQRRTQTVKGGAKAMAA